VCKETITTPSKDWPNTSSARQTGGWRLEVEFFFPLPPAESLQSPAGIHATDSQGARAPPPEADPDAPELPFHSDCDGIAYQLEPWEQARRQRLQQYDRLRDELAGIVVYDGEWDENNWQPSETDAWPQTLDESQATAFPDDINQSPPQEWEEQQWDQSENIWQDTQLAQWAAQQGT